MTKSIFLLALLTLISTSVYAHENVVVIPLGKTVNIEAPIAWQGQWLEGTGYIEGIGIQYLG